LPDELARPLPKNREAEQVVLGAAMLEPDSVIPQLLQTLQPDDFYWKAHQIIYRVILELFEGGKPADLITVGNRLDELNKLDEVGGRAYLSELLTKVTTTASVPYYAEIIKKKAVLRALIAAGHQIAELGFTEEMDLETLLDAAEEKIFQISRFQLTHDFHLIRDFLHEHLEHLERLQRDPSQHAVTGLPTGYKRFDEMTAGLQPSDLIVIAARPSMGKTSLALSIARNMALRFNKCVGFFSLEMTKEQLLERLLCAEARINLHRLRGGYLQTDSESWRRIIHAASKLQNSKIIIDDTPSISVLELKAKARRMKTEHGLDILFVDYLQLVEAGAHTDVREQEVAYIARSLKALARELNIPVVALSQLSRAPERPPRRPRLSDLRECVTGDTQVIDGKSGDLVEVRNVRPGMTVIALDHEQRLRSARVLDVIPKGVNQVYKVRVQTGREIRATAAHPFLTAEGWRPLRDLVPGDLIATMRSVAQRLGDSWLHQWATSDLLWERIVSITPEGEEPVWDLVVEDVHNFVANGIIVHNSGEIEQTADVVIFLYREDAGSEESPDETESPSPLVHETEIIIGKQRNGPTGSFTLLFHRAYTSFEEYYVGEGPRF